MTRGLLSIREGHKLGRQYEEGFVGVGQAGDARNASRTRYRWLVFDADGTLFDFHLAETTALRLTTRKHGFEYSSHLHDVYNAISAELWGKFERGETTLKKLRVSRFERLFSELGIGAEPVSFNVDFMNDLGRQTQLLPGAEAVVRVLSARFRLLLATNGIAVVQRPRFARSSIRRYFEDVVISDEIGVAKPQTGYMDVAFSRMGHPPKSEVLMIGDKLSSDIAAGLNYGIDTCWFNPDALPLDGFPKPTYEIEDLAEIEGIVDGT
jgi:putative hydrolase of the HAD superfamily